MKSRRLLVLYWPAKVGWAPQSLIKTNTAVEHSEASLSLSLWVGHSLLNKFTVRAHQCGNHLFAFRMLCEHLSGLREIVADWSELDLRASLCSLEKVVLVLALLVALE